MMKRLVLAIAPVLLAGCVIIAVDEDHHDDKKRPKSCAAGDYQYLVGRNEADIDRGRLPSSFRIVCADCAVTMEHNPDRLTVRLDEGNRVVSATCG